MTKGVSSKATKKMLNSIRATGPRFIYPPYCAMHFEMLPVLHSESDMFASPGDAGDKSTHPQDSWAASHIPFCRGVARVIPPPSKSSYSRHLCPIHPRPLHSRGPIQQEAPAARESEEIFHRR